jgi:hypothetical protein
MNLEVCSLKVLKKNWLLWHGGDDKIVVTGGWRDFVWYESDVIKIDEDLWN